MTTFKTPIIAGVFQSEDQAKAAVDELRRRNFAHEQIGVALPQKSKLSNPLSQDFMKLGVPAEQANFYEQAFNSGKIVVSVRPDGRDDEVRGVLRGSGGYDYDAGGQGMPPQQNWTPQGQPINEAGNYGQGDYRQYGGGQMGGQQPGSSQSWQQYGDMQQREQRPGEKGSEG
ncbi:hypothetical protein EI42_06184 [Thermosporothrix hazakensis]|jgi:hypothetical protein|uniref:Heat induced stress protein YflT n=2 Tax=Thermosporothrix TaxID=768650 RepID=A0A326TS78_THEHA|nr:hypothetical protein [Thermosporothrix hazakensis]PZW19203.1 hypothetical protein EI42_06184 [Thermosporothrix hazakensis]BBH89713.1 hypothetical protein KTC_44640 [Thermosporothrix sp. COM3]GCE47900.1 hypothetical protein KTH_27690 [Thermosporothrix hazakensis]